MNSKKPVTLKTIASELGITYTTVSKALRDSSDIALVTQQKVKKLAKELGYRPNLLAKSLASKKSYTIGAIVPEILTSHHSFVVNGFYKAARARGYEVVIMVSNESAKNEEHSLQYLSALSVDGIVISISEETVDGALMKDISERGIPIVFFGRSLEELNFSTVTTDDEKSTKLLMDHLVSIGKEKIAFLGPHDRLNTSKHIFAGYKKSLKKHNLEYDDDLVVTCKINPASGCSAMESLLSNGNIPDALLCVNDLIAVGAGKAIQRAGYSIAEDIIIAGSGNLIETKYTLHQPIVTVDHFPEQIGKKVIDVLIDIIEKKLDEDAPKTIYLESELVLRDVENIVVC